MQTEGEKWCIIQIIVRHRSERMQKVSVITMTYNDISHLEKSTAQILKQDYENLEYIIVDGGSTDGTTELIGRLAGELGERLKWISEPDEGLYDALNKGISMATGDIIGIMCDEFADTHVVTRMVETMEREQTDGVHGDVNYVDGEKIVRKWRMGPGGGMKSIRRGWMPAHPTLYLKKEVYETYGLYKINYKIAADYEFMIRILKDDKVRLSYIDDVLVHMFHGENSTSTGGALSYLHSLQEGHRALKENGIPLAWITDARRIVRVLGQFGNKA